MMYPYMTLSDGTEITHSEMKPDGKVKVYIETPDEKICFRHAACWLPEYKWEDIYAYSDADLERFQEIIESTAHLIMEFSQEGDLIVPQIFRFDSFFRHNMINIIKSNFCIYNLE